MEDKRTTKLELDEGALTKYALDLHRKYSAFGREIPTDELMPLRDAMRELEETDEFKWKNFRFAIGDLALKGQKDLAVALMRLIFGERDAKLVKNVIVLMEATGFTPRQYDISSMVQLHDIYTEQIHKFTDVQLAKSAAHGLAQFLTAVGSPEVKQRILINEEILCQAEWQEEVESQFLRGQTKEEITQELQNIKATLNGAWQSFRASGFDRAPELTTQILNLTTLKSELKANKSGIPAQKPYRPATENLRVKAAALQRLATQLHREAEDFTGPDSLKLVRRAGEIEHRSEEIFGTTAIPSAEEVAHD